MEWTWVDIVTLITSICALLYTTTKLVYNEVRGRVNEKNIVISCYDSTRLKDGEICIVLSLSIYNKMCKCALITSIALHDGNQTIPIGTNNDGVFEWVVPSGVRLTTKFTLNTLPKSSNCELKLVINDKPLKTKVNIKNF